MDTAPDGRVYTLYLSTTALQPGSAPVAALEALAPDQVAEQVERLAHHALRGEVWDKAVTYCQQAGARAHERAAFREAVASFDQALQALQHTSEHGDTRGLASELRLALGNALTTLGEYGRHLALLGEAETLARGDALGMRPLVAHCHHGLGTLYRHLGQLRSARAALSTAIALYRALEMPFWLAQAEVELARCAGEHC